MEKEKKNELMRTLKFTLFSISAGAVEIVSFTLFNEVFRFAEWLSTGLSLFLSVVWNFTFNRKFTFRSANNVPIAMLKVLAFYVVFTPFSMFSVQFLCNKGLNEYLAKGILMIINFATEYLYQRFFVFGKSIDTAVDKKNVKKKEDE